MAIFAEEHPFTFGDLNYSNGGQYGPLRCISLSVTVLLEGEASVSTDGLTQQFYSKTAILTLCKTSYAIKYPTGKKSRSIWCETFDFQPSSDLIQQLQNVPTNLSPSERLISLLEIGVKLKQDEGLKISRIESLLGKLCFEEYFHMANLYEESVPVPEPVLRTKRHIQMHYGEDCNLEHLAKISGLTGRHLIRLFQKYFNYTPSHYLWKIRLEKSAQLLCRSGLTIGEVAFQCGFQSQAHFSRAIKKHYGYSPSELRKRNWYQDLEILGQDIKHEIY